MNCVTGESLAEEQERASGKEQVLMALDKAAPKLRTKLGESLSTVQKFDTPLEQATTPSLEALQAYSLGRKILLGKGDLAAAIPLFQRAIQLDPNFAMAYASLGCLSKSGRTQPGSGEHTEGLRIAGAGERSRRSSTSSLTTISMSPATWKRRGRLTNSGRRPIPRDDMPREPAGYRLPLHRAT